MICVFDKTNTTFAGNGNAVLMPISCSHRQAAAGKYDLSIVHPIDATGKWAHIVPEAIIRAPVPEETIETAYSGMDVDVYRTTASAALRSGPSEPEAITYSAYQWGHDYSAGDKVTYKSQNYKCTVEHTSLPLETPENRGDRWVEIANQTSGSPALVQLKSGTSLYYVETTSATWYKMSTTYGMEGYIKKSQVEYWKHLTPSENQPRTVTEQLFRIKNVTVDSKNNTITATAEHVSYDMSGVLVKDAKIAQKTPATALAWVEQNFMIDYRGTIATNLTASSDGTYTGEIKGKNATYALLDPDKGIVATFRAKYQRDNWDVFVMRKTATNRGFRLVYAKNMLGVNWKIKSDQLITRVVPVAKDEYGEDFYLSGNGWVDSSHINEYPVIRMERIKVNGQVGKDDGTETETTWTEQTLRAEMTSQAQKRFSVDKADLLIHEITVDFEMMGDTEEYQALQDLERVLMYDTVTVINPEISLSVTAEVVEIEYDCIRKKITALKLSNVNAYGGRSVSGFSVFPNSVTADKLTDDVTDGIGQRAVSDAGEYTDKRVTALNYQLKQWVNDNFQPIS